MDHEQQQREKRQVDEQRRVEVPAAERAANVRSCADRPENRNSAGSASPSSCSTAQMTLPLR